MRRVRRAWMMRECGTDGREACEGGARKER